MTETEQPPEPKKKTDIHTRRVFRRAERNDPIIIEEIVERFEDKDIPEDFEVIRRQQTYFGQKFYIEVTEGTEQYKLTIQDMHTEAILWKQFNMEWNPIAEVIVKLGDDLPQYDICDHCGEPIKTATHEQASVIGNCDR